MSKLNLVVILVLSVVVTYGVALLQFAVGIMNGGGGLPFNFSTFNFLGSETNYLMLILDIIFWFVIISGIWILIQRFSSK